jgi:hypothetical protein
MWTPGHIHELESGHSWYGGFAPGFNSKLKPGTGAWFEAGAAWDILRDQILREWIDPDHRRIDCTAMRRGAGTRPWAWWHLDKRERRRRLNGVHPFDIPARIAEVARREALYPGQAIELTKLHFGTPGAMFFQPDDFEARYESQPQYLQRLGLWLPGERELFIKLHGDEDLR